MRALRIALQAAILYLAATVILGMSRHTSFNFLHVLSMGSFFVGLLLITVIVQRAARTFTPIVSRHKRFAVVGCLALFAALLFVLAQGVAVGVWRGPPRFAALHFLVAQFAGAWSLVLTLALAACILLLQAYGVLRQQVA
jgi:hypothetical protein